MREPGNLRGEHKPKTVQKANREYDPQQSSGQPDYTRFGQILNQYR